MGNRIPTDYANKTTAVGTDSCFGYDSVAVDNKNITVQAIADFVMTDKDSDDLGEGATNLYYTDARKAAIASNAYTFTNKVIDADATGNVITNIGSSEVKSELITGQSTVTPASDDAIMISDTSDSGNLKKILVSALPAPELNTYTLGSTVTAGDQVIMQTDGKVYKWAGYNDAGVEYSATSITAVRTFYVDTNTIVTAFFTSANAVIVQAGSVSTTGVITYGSPVTLDGSASGASEIQAIKVDTNSGVVMYTDASTNIMVHPFTVSGTVITAGTRGQINSITTFPIGIFDICLIDTNKIYATYASGAGSALPNARVGLIAGNAITFGTEVLNYNSGSTVTEVRCCKIDTDKVLTTYVFNADIITSVATISTTTITVAYSNRSTYTGTAVNHSIYQVDTNKAIVVFDETDIKGFYITVSSTTPTNQTARTLVSATVLLNAGKPLIQLNANLYGIVSTNSGTITWFIPNATDYTMTVVKTIDYRVSTGASVIFAKSNALPLTQTAAIGKFFINDTNVASKKTYMLNYDSRYLLGVAQESGTVGQSKFIATPGQTSTVNSGLSVGEKYYASSTGTYTLNPTAFGTTTGQVAFIGKALSATSMLVDINLEDL